MHLYTFALASALNELGVKAILLSTRDTARSDEKPENVRVKSVFRGVYGHAPRVVRGVCYCLSLLRIAYLALVNTPNVMHFHFFQIPWLDLALLLWLRLLGIHIVITVHDVLPFEFGINFGSIPARVYKLLYSMASGLIVHSIFARDCLEQLDTNLLEKARVIRQGNYLGLPLKCAVSQETARQELGLASAIPVILVFGTIKPNKRLDIVIRAIKEIRTCHPSIMLVVAGKPQNVDVSTLIQLGKQLDLESNIRWEIRYLTDEELIKYISSADIVVFPYQWIYNSAALLMAMSLARPVIATSVGSNPETIEHTKTGLLVPSDSVEDLTDAITMLLGDSDAAHLMGKSARDYVLRELSWSRIAKKTLEFYLDCEKSR